MFAQYTYLYVEDDPLSREIMQVVMESMMGITTLVQFEDSVDFLPRLNSLTTKPDFILLDIHIEPHSGLDVLRMIRHSGQYPQSRIIALTASVMNEEVQQLRDSGFDGAIAKPIDVTLFPQLMQRIIQGEAVWHIA